MNNATLPKFIRYFHNLARKNQADRTGERLVMFRVLDDDKDLDKELADAVQVWLIYDPPVVEGEVNE